MKNIWKIYSTDIRKTATNWMALIIIGGLIILPSLYAWFNIKASWDPYGQLDQLPVGIVNEDQGAMVRDQKIHVGDDLEETLKDNDSLDWHFDDRETAMDKVKYGDYFAVIIIPENFSEKLASVTSGDPEKANVEYYVNEKINAISPKMTDKGASVIVENVSSQFISTVNGVIFDVLNQIGIELQSDLPDIEQFEEYLFTIEKKLPDIYDTLNETLTDAGSAEGIIHDAQGLIPEVERVTNNGIQTIDDTMGFLTEAENRLNEMAPQIQKDLDKIQEVTGNVNDFLQGVETFELDTTSGDELTEKIDTQVDDAISRIESIQTALTQLEKQVPTQQGETDSNSAENNTETDSAEEPTESTDGDEKTETEESEDVSIDHESVSNQFNEDVSEQLNQTINQLGELKTGLEEIKNHSLEITSTLEEKYQDVNSFITNLKEKAETISTDVDAFVAEYKETIEPTVRQEIGNAKSTLKDAKGIIVDIQDTLPEVENILNRTDSNLQDGTDLLEDVLGEYPYVNSKITELADRVRKVQGETDINEIIELLRNDPEAEKNFFEEPVTLEANKIFPIENYGAGMTPFYTALAIWVGGLLLISLLTTEVANQEPFTLKQEYFGKLLTFLTIGILQTLIITFGDLFLLKVDIAHANWFIFFGLFISLVFMILIYTLVSIFGDVGKAMVIVILVLQIAGSGGTYPVVLLPEFFQAINPFLPFTYAIDLLREAVGGIVWERASRDIMVLSLFGLAALLLGTFLKQPINKHTRKLVAKSRESNMFH